MLGVGGDELIPHAIFIAVNQRVRAVHGRSIVSIYMKHFGAVAKAGRRRRGVQLHGTTIIVKRRKLGVEPEEGAEVAASAVDGADICACL
jgi:hypothetical protein